MQAALTSMEEYQYLQAGHNRKVQLQWEIARWQQYYQTILSPNIKEGRKPRRPQDIMHFPWDEDRNDVDIDLEEITESEIKGLCAIFNIDRSKVTN